MGRGGTEGPAFVTLWIVRVHECGQDDDTRERRAYVVARGGGSACVRARVCPRVDRWCAVLLLATRTDKGIECLARWFSYVNVRVDRMRTFSKKSPYAKDPAEFQESVGMRSIGTWASFVNNKYSCSKFAFDF